MVLDLRRTVMSRKFNQSREVTQKFSSKLFEYMKGVMEVDPKHVFTKPELCAAFDFSERYVRRELERIANYYPVIATSDSIGYRLGLFDDSMSEEELEDLCNDYDHQLAELQSRVESLYARMKPLLAAKVKIKERIK